ncbi:IPExxxVDY family protein [Flavobacterium aquiphilum]|uniref:IPExxxVDY family protein n=1 Tax=Flavobacterium aquiphilum TaxID=3003261 RepID=UPI002481628B|nr:IPExxxVDY family protein [Flavobacterium aquiphilum]
MAIHKLDFDDFDEIDYSLIAIHTSLEDYRLAYFINQKLHVNLNKSIKEIQITVKEGEAHFSRFHYYEKKKEISWDLIQNKNEVIHQQKEENQSLFSNIIDLEAAKKVYMLPEFKKVEYFLKIENCEMNLNLLEIMNKLNTIDNVAMTYIVDTNRIKSKNNLIF